MLLEIKLNQSEVELKLLKNRRTIDFITAKYYHDLSDVLITGLDKLLRRNKIDTTTLKSFKIKGNLGQDSTSYKITSALVEALKLRDRS